MIVSHREPPSGRARWAPSDGSGVASAITEGTLCTRAMVSARRAAGSVRESAARARRPAARGRGVARPQRHRVEPRRSRGLHERLRPRLTNQLLLRRPRAIRLAVAVRPLPARLFRAGQVPRFAELRRSACPGPRAPPGFLHRALRAAPGRFPDRQRAVHPHPGTARRPLAHRARPHVCGSQVTPHAPRIALAVVLLLCACKPPGEGVIAVECGPLIDGATPTYKDATGVAVGAEARKAVDQRAVAGADYIAIYTRITPALLRPLMDEAGTLRLAVAAHLGKIDALAAARAGVASIEHISGVVEAASPNPASYYRAHDRFLAGWTMEETGWGRLG